MKHITLKDFLTDREIQYCIYLSTSSSDRTKGVPLARLICQEVIEPSINRINRTLGQQNDPMYLAYAVEYAITQLKRK
jgi:hypothetical protein